jgi:tetratricopeptide (TPR) repeat protein
MRALVILAALAVLALPLVAQNGADTKKVDADKLYNEGNTLYRSGDFAGAITKYQGALALADDYKYRYQLGLAYKNTRKTDDAIAQFEKSVELKPDFAVGHYALGTANLSARSYAEAINHFKMALQYDPSMDRAKTGIAEAYSGEAQRLSDEGQLQAASKLCDEALALHSSNSKLLLIAARVYNKSGDSEKALEAAKSALEYKKRGAKGAEYFELGIAYKRMNDYTNARAAFNEAKKDPTYSRNAQYELDGLKGK